MRQPVSKSVLLSVQDLHKTYESEFTSLEVLKGISFEMDRGDSLAVTGPSGSGKSTLLHILGTLDNPSKGRVRVDGEDPFALAEEALARFRNRKMGFIFQDHHLLPQYSVLENVLVPTLAFKDEREGKSERAKHLIERVGLAERIDHRPAQLSGGERQRVAIARALINDPDLMLCDEPTGNLDHATAEAVANLLFDLHRERENILIVVTHSLGLAERFPRRFEFADGNIKEG